MCQWPLQIAHFWPLKIAHIEGAPVKGAERPPRGLPRPDLAPSCPLPSRVRFLGTDRSSGHRMDRFGEFGVPA